MKAARLPARVREDHAAGPCRGKGGAEEGAEREATIAAPGGPVKDSGGPLYSRAVAPRSGQAEGLFEKPDVPITIVPDSPIRGSWRAAREYLRKHLQGESFANLDTGWDISLGKRGVRKITSGDRSAANMNAVVAIQKLLEQAVLAESHPDREGGRDIRAVHRFYAPLELQGEIYRAKLTVFETVDGQRLYDHGLTEIESPLPKPRHTAVLLKRQHNEHLVGRLEL